MFAPPGVGAGCGRTPLDEPPSWATPVHAYAAGYVQRVRREQLRRFAAMARQLDANVRGELCGILALATAAPLVELLGDFALGNDAALVNRLLSPPAKEGSAH